MKLIKIIILFLPFLLIAQSNTKELETLEKLYSLKNKEDKENAEAKEIIYGYYFDTKDEVRKKRNKLSDNAYKEISDYQSKLWSEIMLQSKGYNSKSFLFSHQKSLKTYRELVLDKLYDLINEQNQESYANYEYVIDTMSSYLVNSKEVIVTKNYLISNNWKDDNSEFKFYSNGSFYIKWDNGEILWTKWELKNKILNIGIGLNNKMIPHRILSSKENYFQYIADNSNTVYTAKRE